MKRSLWIMLAILLVLVLAVVLVLQKPGETSSSSGTEGTLVSYDSAAIDKLVIISSSGSVTLEKDGTSWLVTSPARLPADEAAVAAAIGKGASLTLKGIVSSNPQKQSVFQVDSAGTLVRVFEKGTEKAAFRVGKLGSTYMETYVRREGSNDVYIADGMINYIFAKSVREWRDKTIFKTAQENIKSVRFQYGDTTFALSLQDSTWRVDGQPTQEYAVRGLLSSLSHLQADEFVDTAVTAMPPISAVVDVEGVQLRFHINQANNYFVASSRTQQLYEIQGWHAEQILKRKKQLVTSPS
jgi:hypothetical protein